MDAHYVVKKQCPKRFVWRHDFIRGINKSGTDNRCHFYISCLYHSNGLCLMRTRISLKVRVSMAMMFAKKIKAISHPLQRVKHHEEKNTHRHGKV